VNTNSTNMLDKRALFA